MTSNSFFYIDYHSPRGKGKRKAIVAAENAESAAGKFTRGDNTTGMDFEVDKVRPVKEIPAGWDSHVAKDANAFPVVLKVTAPVSLEDPETEIGRGFQVKHIVHATPTQKDHVIKNRRMW